jgi:hypothetical protein
VKALSVVLVLLVAVHLHVTVWFAGVPFSVPLLALVIPVAVVIAAVVAWAAWGIPRRGWPRLAWKGAAS